MIKVMAAIGPRECPGAINAVALAVHGDPGVNRLQPTSSRQEREQLPLFRIHDPRSVEAADSLVQRFNAEIARQRVRDMPDQQLTCANQTMIPPIYSEV